MLRVLLKIILFLLATAVTILLAYLGILFLASYWAPILFYGYLAISTLAIGFGLIIWYRSHIGNRLAKREDVQRALLSVLSNDPWHTNIRNIFSRTFRLCVLVIYWPVIAIHGMKSKRGMPGALSSGAISTLQSIEPPPPQGFVGHPISG